MTKITHIYGLVDPFTREIRYIGKTILNPSQRLCSHVSEARRSDIDRRHYHKNRWISNLLAKGAYPEVIILETVLSDDWQDAEKRWIQKGRDLGWRLTNLSDGGEGTPGYPCPDEKKLHLSKLLSGRKRSQEAIERTRQKLLGRKPSTEAVRKASEARQVYQITDEIIELLGKSTDYDIGTRFNIHPATIRKLRVKRGIPRYKGKRYYQHIDLPEECLQQLGKMPDNQLAAMYEVSPQTIRRRRRDRGISPVVEPGAGRIENPIVAAIAHLMGTMSDKDLAKLYNVNSKAIWYHRKKMGIPPFKKG